MNVWFAGAALVLIVAALCLVCVAFVKLGQNGKKAKKKRCCSTAASNVGPGAQISYAVGLSAAVSIGNNLAIASAFGGENAFDFILMPIDPLNPTDTTRVLNSYGWAAAKAGTLSDLQVVFPTGDISVPGMTMFAQVWQSPACNGTWTGTALVASHQFGEDGSAFCMSDNTHTVPFAAGDRLTLVYSVDTGAWTPTASQIPDGISAGLAYAFQT